MNIFYKILVKVIKKNISKTNNVKKLYLKLPKKLQKEKEVVCAVIDKYFSYLPEDNNLCDFEKLSICNEQSKCYLLGFLPKCYLNDIDFIEEEINKCYLIYYIAGYNIRDDINICKKAFVENRVDGRKIWYYFMGENVKNNLEFLYSIKNLKEDILKYKYHYNATVINYPRIISEKVSMFILKLYYASKKCNITLEDLFNEYSLLARRGYSFLYIKRLLYLKYMSDDDKLNLVNNKKYNNYDEINNIYIKKLKRINFIN